MAEDMEALEQFGVSVGVKTNGAFEFFFKFLENFFGHFSVSYTVFDRKLTMIMIDHWKSILLHQSL